MRFFYATTTTSTPTATTTATTTTPKPNSFQYSIIMHGIDVTFRIIEIEAEMGEMMSYGFTASCKKMFGRDQKGLYFFRVFYQLSSLLVQIW